MAMQTWFKKTFHTYASLSFPEAIMFGLWGFFFILLIVGFLGKLNAISVLLALLFLFVFSLPVIIRFFIQIKSHPHPFHANKDFYLILIGSVLFLSLFLLARGSYSVDAYYYWIPWGTAIAQTHHIAVWGPSFSLSYFSFPPYWPLSIASIAILLPKYQYAFGILPFVFTLTSITILITWAQEREYARKMQILCVLLFLCNAEMLSYGWDAVVESLLILGFCLFFYFFEKTWHTPQSLRYWSLVLMAFILAVMTKLSALLLIIPLLFLVFSKRRSIPWFLVTSVGIGISLPFILWCLRNTLFFENPFFPFFNDFFPGRYSEIYRLSNPFLFWEIYYPSLLSRFFLIVQKILTLFPILPLALVGTWHSRLRTPYITMLLCAIAASIFFVFSASAGTRYFLPYLPLLTLFAVHGIHSLSQRISKWLIWIIAIWPLTLLPPGLFTENGIRLMERIWPEHLSALSILVTLCIGVLLAGIGFYASTHSWLWKTTVLFLFVVSGIQFNWVQSSNVGLHAFILIIISCCVLLYAGLLPSILNPQKKIYAILVTSAVFLFSSTALLPAAAAAVRSGSFSWPHPDKLQRAQELEKLMLRSATPLNGSFLSMDSAFYFPTYTNWKFTRVNSFAFVKKTGAIYHATMNPEESTRLFQMGGYTHFTQVSGEHTTNPLALQLELHLNAHPEQYARSCSPIFSDVCLWKILYSETSHVDSMREN